MKVPADVREPLLRCPVGQYSDRPQADRSPRKVRCERGAEQIFGRPKQDSAAAFPRARPSACTGADDTSSRCCVHRSQTTPVRDARRAPPPARLPLQGPQQAACCVYAIQTTPNRQASNIGNISSKRCLSFNPLVSMYRGRPAPVRVKQTRRA